MNTKRPKLGVDLTEGQVSPLDDVLNRLRQGQVTPDEADAELRRKGFPALTTRPASNRFDPMKTTTWSLPMVLAWAATRDSEAVRSHDNRIRAASWDYEKDGDGWRLVRPKPLTFSWSQRVLLGDARVSPRLEERKRLIAEVSDEILFHLANGTIHATAVKVLGGSVVAVAAATWPHLVIKDDHGRDSLCLAATGALAYVDVNLRLDEILKAWPPAQRAVTTARGQSDCKKFCDSLMAKSPEKPTTKLDSFVKEATAKFRISPTEAKRIWRECNKRYPAWRKTGPKGPRQRENVTHRRGS
jgi:hypothetical protein